MQGRRVAVIGAGIVGVTSAYELAAQGYEVTVFERRGSVAEEASFAISGLIAPAYISPWAAPGLPTKLLCSMVQAHAPMSMRWPLGLSELAWLNKWRQNCHPRNLESRQLALSQLADLSRQRLMELMTRERIEMEVRNGLLVVARSERELLALTSRSQALKARDIACSLLNREQTIEIEPALNPDTELAGALHLPQAISTNCRQFAGLLRNASVQRAVQWRFDTTVMSVAPGRQVQLQCQQHGHPLPVEIFDEVVLCAGLPSSQLLAPLGVKIPLMALHGYSISAPVREPLNAPFASVLDERHQVSISRLENRVRISGLFELGGDPQRNNQKSLRTLYKILNDWFPGAATTSGAVQEWKGTRHALPDGLPIIGRAGLDGIWLNLGHGTHGWALACGSAVLLREQMSEQKPSLPINPFQLLRS